MPSKLVEPKQSGGAAVLAQGLRHQYGVDTDRELTVLAGIDLDFAPGSRIAITGRSGVGKTTLLALLGGLERLQEGVLRVGGTDLCSLNSDELAAYRRDTVGFVFQHFGLLPSLTALENVEFAMSMAAIPRAKRTARAGMLLDAVGVGARAGHRPSELSGGEAQRVALARAVANQPRLVLADEPTGNLDTESSALVLDLLDSLASEHGSTLVVATHDPAVAALAEHHLSLEAGRLVAS